MLSHRAVYLPTFSHFLMVNKLLSLSLFLSLSLSLSLSLALSLSPLFNLLFTGFQIFTCWKDSFVDSYLVFVSNFNMDLNYT